MDLPPSSPLSSTTTYPPFLPPTIPPPTSSQSNDDDDDDDDDEKEENTTGTSKEEFHVNTWAWRILDSCGYFTFFTQEEEENNNEKIKSNDYYFHLLELSLDILMDEKDPHELPPYIGNCKPFPILFYYNLAKLLIGILDSTTTTAAANSSFHKDIDTNVFQYSLFQQDYTVRMIHILYICFNQLDVSSSSSTTTTCKDSFLYPFLYGVYHDKQQEYDDYNSSSSLTTEHDSPIPTMHDCDTSVHISPTTTTTTTSTATAFPWSHTVSILRALFQQYHILPQLQSYIHQYTRKLRNSILQQQSQNHNKNNNTSLSIGISSISTVSNTTIKTSHDKQRIQSMEQVHNLQHRLEQEFKQHVYEVEYILGSCYKLGHKTIRSTCRLFMGHYFKSFLWSCCSSHSRSRSSTSSSSIRARRRTTPIPTTTGLSFHGSSDGDYHDDTTTRTLDTRIPRTIDTLGFEDTQAAGIDSMLRILLRILKGIPLPTCIRIQLDNRNENNNKDNSSQQEQQKTLISSLQSSHIDLLFSILIPLHKPSNLVLWRDQTPILELYHEPLVQCIATLVLRDPKLVPTVIADILHPEIWPSEGSGMSSTPKIVLLLHEIDTYISLLDTMNKEYSYSFTELLYPMFTTMIAPLCVRLGSCISSDNSRTSERALQFFKNSQWVELVHFFFPCIGPTLVRSLVRLDTGMDVPWNPTVRRMTLLVLRELEAYNPIDFKQVCNSLFIVPRMKSYHGPFTKDNASIRVVESNELISSTLTPPCVPSFIHNKNSIPPGAILPSVPRSNRNVSPRVTTTEFMSRPGMKKQTPLKGDLSNNPPLTITGVAPWATQVQKVVEKSVGTMMLNSSLDAISENQLVEESNWHKVVQYMNQLEDKHDERSNNISLKYDSMGESPILLPNLKFHDLVFGGELGKGAFSTVKYAKLIIKGQNQSTWPEYAVKVIKIVFVHYVNEYSIVFFFSNFNPFLFVY